jgi:radical SAM protein (TIGR01212 family)
LPYLSLNQYFREKYKKRVQKITVSLPFSCPNRDGKISKGGCIYCYNGSMPPKNSLEIPLEKQIEDGILRGKKKFGKDTLFMVYFQTYSNTYAGVDELKSRYDTALKYADVIGIDVGTRPDCISDGILDLLKSYSDKLQEVWIEYGLQSANDSTLKRINRGHNVACFTSAVKIAKEKGLKVIAHMIAGFPWENKNDFINTAGLIAPLAIDGIKIHPLYVMEGTELGEQYKNSKFNLLILDEYTGILADIIEILPKDMVVMRFTAEGGDKGLIAPEYCRPQYKYRIKEMLVEELKKRGTCQGSKFRANMSMK